MNKFTKALGFNDNKHEYRVNGKVIPSVTELCGPLTYSKYRVDNAVVDQAAFRGSLIHEKTMEFDLGELPGDEMIASDVAPYLMAWKDFCRDYEPEWDYIEIPLACRTFAGTIDRVGWIDSRLVVVDIKTSSAMDRANKIALTMQLFGYTELLHRNSIEASFENSIGVQLKKDGKYSIINSDQVCRKYGFDPVELWLTLEKLNTLTKGERYVE